MPTYEYACTECADRVEVVQRFSDDPLTVCGVCGGRLRKVFSPVGIVFKGSGFYRTDSRSGSVGAGVNGNGKAADGSSGSDGGSGDKAEAGAKADAGKSGDGASSSSKSGESGSSGSSGSGGASGGSSNGSSGASKSGSAGGSSKAGSKVA